MREVSYEIDLIFPRTENYSVPITHEITGFLVSYQAIGFDDLGLELTDFELLLERIRKLSVELGVKPNVFIIELFQDGMDTASCVVDERQVLHLKVPVNIINKKMTVPDRGIDENYLLYHELMHAKDVLEHRIDPSGRIDIINNFPDYLRNVGNVLFL